MYKKIINPKTNRSVNINSKQGKNIITTYYNILKGAGENDRTGRTVQWAGPDGIRRPAWQIAGPPPHEEEQEGGGHAGRKPQPLNKRMWFKILTQDGSHVWLQFRVGATGDDVIRALNRRYPNKWDCVLGGDLYHKESLEWGDDDVAAIGDDRLTGWVGTNYTDWEKFVLEYFPPNEDDSDEDDSDEDDSDEDDYDKDD